jgi:hypothetical protein
MRFLLFSETPRWEASVVADFTGNEMVTDFSIATLNFRPKQKNCKQVRAVALGLGGCSRFSVVVLAAHPLKISEACGG